MVIILVRNEVDKPHYVGLVYTLEKHGIMFAILFKHDHKTKLDLDRYLNLMIFDNR